MWTWRLRRARWLAQHRAQAHWVQYGKKRSSDGKLVETYPSKAACNNDTCWGRGGYYSVARPMQGDTPIGEWRRNYVEDIKTLRMED